MALSAAGLAIAVALAGAAPASGPSVKLEPYFQLRRGDAVALAKLAPAQHALLDAYLAGLADAPSEKQTSFEVTSADVPAFRGQLVRIEAWADGGHRRLAPGMFLVRNGDVRLLRAASEPADRTGEGRRFTDVLACKPELAQRLGELEATKAKGTAGRIHDLESDLCDSLGSRLLDSLASARKSGALDPNWLKGFAGLLAMLADQAQTARVISTAPEIGDDKLKALVETGDNHDARWVGKKGAPLAVFMAEIRPDGVAASGSLVVQTDSATSWLKSFRLRVDAKGFELVETPLAHTIESAE